MGRHRFLLIICLLASPASGVEFVTGHLKGCVRDSAGQPIADAKVWLNRAEGARMDWDRRPSPATTDESGNYELALRFEHGKTLLVREVFVEKPGYVRAGPDLKVPLKADETATQDFALEKGEIFAGELRVPLRSFERKMIERPRRWFRVVGPALGPRVHNAHAYQAEPDGRFEIYLPPGEYTAELAHYGPEKVVWEHLATGRTDHLLEVPPFQWSPEPIGKAFDELWNTMDNYYSYFFLKPDVDWSKLKEQYREKAVHTANAEELASVLQEMCAPLRDLHVWIETDKGLIPTYRSSWTYNGNRDIVLAQLDEKTLCGDFAIVGKTEPDGFGYFLMLKQSAANKADVQQAVDAVRKLNAAPGFIVDLRNANGGSEPLAQEIARLFCPSDTLYAKSKRRNGPGHDQFGKENIRILRGTEDAYTRPVVCLIGPGAVSSGEGFVKMMKCLPHVMTVGLRTRGASGNPGACPVGQTGVVVYYSQWVDMMPDGQTFEGKGIPPDVEVNAPGSDYADRDPTLEKGLELLRQKVASSESPTDK